MGQFISSLSSSSSSISSISSSCSSIIKFDHLTTRHSVLACFSMSSLYVGSLYLWSKQNRLNRNDPAVIKRRFVSVTITSILSLCLVNLLGKESSDGGQTLASWVGLNSLHPIQPTLSSLSLTVILFSGPVVQYVLTGFLESDYYRRTRIGSHLLMTQQFFKYAVSFARPDYFLPMIWRELNDPSMWRNYIVSPFTEEFVFRSCMLPLVVPTLGPTRAIFITPLFFGLAHLHHFIEGYLNRSQPVSHLVAQNVFQFSYTYLFGIYSSFLFVRTGSFLASFLNHSFCNYMGFPNVAELVSEGDNQDDENEYYSSGLLSKRSRVAVSLVYVAGLTSFSLLLTTLT